MLIFLLLELALPTTPQLVTISKASIYYTDRRKTMGKGSSLFRYIS
jgi:hypothetical protein